MLGARTYFALLPSDVKDLVKAYYHHASEAWIHAHREVEILARQKSVTLTTNVTMHRWRNGEPVEEAIFWPPKPQPSRHDYLWVDAKPHAGWEGFATTPWSPITITAKTNLLAPLDWRNVAQVPWIAQPIEEERARLRQVWRAAQYDLVAARLACKAAALEYDYPDLYERVCEWLLGVSTARGRVHEVV